MNTPLCDFLDRYAADPVLRLHMPGHKGMLNPWDITEIPGADSLYEASGILAESEHNAGTLFGCRTYYSTEGSSQCIRAMLYLTVRYAAARGVSPRILAGRNAHRTFVSAAALLDMPVGWLPLSDDCSYLSCPVDPAELERQLREQKPVAVYLTTPDYLGNRINLSVVAEICHRQGVLLLVDNAHGAYLRFLTPSQHPVDAGADLCCDSAHKTLPVLTGGAYLHLSAAVEEELYPHVRTALALFGSTSPSYLILRSLDAANRYLADGYSERLSTFVETVSALKDRLKAQGYVLQGNEPLKITVCTKPYGWRGTDFADRLAVYGVVCEFADPDFVVLMLTPEIGEEGLKRLEQVLLTIPQQAPLHGCPPSIGLPEQAMSPRKALLSPAEIIPVSQSVGRILSAVTVCCPPAVPIAVSGERLNESTLAAFQYYGITTCTVVKEE